MKLNDPNILGIERYAEANYYQDLMFHKDWPRISWDEIELEDRDRYRTRAIVLVDECKTLCTTLGHELE